MVLCCRIIHEVNNGLPEMPMLCFWLDFFEVPSSYLYLYSDPRVQEIVLTVLSAVVQHQWESEIYNIYIYNI